MRPPKCAAVNGPSLRASSPGSAPGASSTNAEPLADDPLVVRALVPFVSRYRQEKIELQRGIRREVPEHAGHQEILLSSPDLDGEPLSHRVVVAEIFLRGLPGQDDAVRPAKGAGRVAGEEGKREHREEIGIGEHKLFLPEDPVAVGHDRAAGRDPGGAHDLRVFGQQGRHERHRLVRVRLHLPARFPHVGHDPVDPVAVGVEAVVGELVPDEQRDQDAESDPDRQPEDVDQCVELVADEVAERDLEVITEHRGGPFGPFRQSIIRTAAR